MCICICFYMCICLCSFDCLCAVFASISAGTSSVIRGAIVAVFVSSFHCFFSSSLFLSLVLSFLRSFARTAPIVSVSRFLCAFINFGQIVAAATWRHHHRLGFSGSLAYKQFYCRASSNHSSFFSASLLPCASRRADDYSTVVGQPDLGDMMSDSLESVTESEVRFALYIWPINKQGWNLSKG